jgi:hypothetical protein
MSTIPSEIGQQRATANGGGSWDPFRLMTHAMRALSERVYLWVVLAMTFSLFAWTILHPDWLRLAAACAFTVLVLVPLAWRER